MFEVLDIGASGLTAQRIRMDTLSSNMANINTRYSKDGQKVPYRRKIVEFQEGLAGDSSKPGVHVKDIKEDQTPFQVKHDPGNPDADKDGNVLYPAMDLTMEYVNALEASRSYEANVTMMDTAKSMISSSLRILA
jgi:flagellar basal-body rod protein FlgC